MEIRLPTQDLFSLMAVVLVTELKSLLSCRMQRSSRKHSEITDCDSSVSSLCWSKVTNGPGAAENQNQPASSGWEHSFVVLVLGTSSPMLKCLITFVTWGEESTWRQEWQETRASHGTGECDCFSLIFVVWKAGCTRVVSDVEAKCVEVRPNNWPRKGQSHILVLSFLILEKLIAVSTPLVNYIGEENSVSMATVYTHSIFSRCVEKK